MRELSVSEQRYRAVLAVISEGETVTDVAARFGVARKTLHVWLAKYEAGGLEGLGDGSHRPRSCPHQMPPVVEVAVAEMRRAHPSWGPRRLVFELAKRGVEPVPSESGVYRCLLRLNLIDPDARRPRDRKWRRWERGVPMELWQMDVVGGFVLADGTRLKALTGVDDHSRFCVSALLMPRESSRQVCAGLALAIRRWGVPEEILTDNCKVFTGRFNQPPVEVLFDRVCRENGSRTGWRSRDRRPRPARSSASIAACVPSSAPTGRSRAWQRRRPSSMRGSPSTTSTVHIKGSGCRPLRNASGVVNHSPR